VKCMNHSPYALDYYGDLQPHEELFIPIFRELYESTGFKREFRFVFTHAREVVCNVLVTLAFCKSVCCPRNGGNVCTRSYKSW
jgi:hypothetical protein